MLLVMGRKVDLDDLIDRHAVAALLGVGKAGAVGLYLRRYPDMPRPVHQSQAGRCQLWLRSEVEAWAAKRRSG
jgi:hypothetical protein